MNSMPYYSVRQAIPSLFLAAVLFLSGCLNKSDIDQFVNRSFDKGLDVSVTKPVDRDFEDIKKSGVLRMITNYSSNTYFLHKGIEKGFEYELVRKFAHEQDLALEVVIVDANENPYDLLNSGAGDLIAANYAITDERKKYVNFTRPYNLVNQVVVFSGEVQNPPGTYRELEERGIPISVRRNSSYYNRLLELQDQGYNIPVNLAPDDMDTESMLFELMQGTYQATIADDNIYQASSRYMSGLVQGPVIAKSDTIAWAIRKNASDLETTMNNFLYKHFRFGGQGKEPKRSTLLNVLRHRYFEGGEQFAEYYGFNPESEVKKSGIISPFDDLIKSVADSAGIDWLLVASIAAQETRFNPKLKSWAGAVGLMQVLPRYSKVQDVQLLYDAEVNLREGVRIISEHLNHYSYMDSTNQWAFALATYNAGLGHVADARRLTIDRNRNPNEWEQVSEALLMLMHRKYYKDARFGFCRGIETVRYVREIVNRHETYKSVIALAERNQSNSGPGIIGLFN